MASITTWMRLEPGCRNPEMRAGLQARIYDPLWLLARQWQIGEFEGEDNGSPAAARWRGESARLTRYHPGPIDNQTASEGQSYDAAAIPLETLIEGERVSPAGPKLEKLRFAVEAGQHFLRMLDQQATSRSYRQLFTERFPFAPLTAEERDALDPDSRSFIEVVAPRVPDGRRLYAAMSSALRPAPPNRPALPRDLAIAPGDSAEVRAAAEAWLHWYDTLYTEPRAAHPTWSAERMEYSFSMATRMTDGEKVLTAQEYAGGRADWHDFNLNDGASLRLGDDSLSEVVTRTVIPAPVSYPGMPSARFWEFEDAQVDFGSVNAGPEDLARMLLVEFAISYGNDWFVLPIELEVGSLCRTDSLVVTNTFGERFLIRSATEAGERYKTWRMFQLASVPRPGEAASVTDRNANLFFLPPALATSLESRAIEEVLFLRDEMANMAWGVERVIESATERALHGFIEQPGAAGPAPSSPPPPSPPSSGQPSEIAIYKLSTEVPRNWIPLLPVQRGGGGGLRLERGKVLRVDGSRELNEARGRILNPETPLGNGLAIFEEEIPREGIRVTRSYQLARWRDGSTHLWIGRHKQIGRGEGSSGLRFDTIDR